MLQPHNADVVIIGKRMDGDADFILNTLSMKKGSEPSSTTQQI